MKKVFLGISDTNPVFLSRFLKNYNYQYDITVGYFSSRFELPKLSSKININFIRLSTLNKRDKINLFESIIKGYDLVISNHIVHLSLAALNRNIPYIQYSDLYMYYELARNKEVLFGKISKNVLKAGFFNSDEIKAYDGSYKNFIYNPLAFFHDFKWKSMPNLLCPYFLEGNPQKEGSEMVLSYSANKTLMKDQANHLSLIDDFGYIKSDFFCQDYYDKISESSNVKIDMDYNLFGDCIFNNVRPETVLFQKTLNNLFLYNFARTLNLSKVIDSIPYAKILDEKQFPTFDQIIMEFL